MENEEKRWIGVIMELYVVRLGEGQMDFYLG